VLVAHKRFASGGKITDRRVSMQGITLFYLLAPAAASLAAASSGGGMARQRRRRRTRAASRGARGKWRRNVANRALAT